MDFSKLSEEEIIRKIKEVSKQIDNIYSDLINDTRKRKDINNDTISIERLKSLIIQERTMIASIPEDKIDRCINLTGDVFRSNTARRVYQLLNYKIIEKKGIAFSYLPKNIMLTTEESPNTLSFIEAYLLMRNQELNKTTIEDAERFNNLMLYLNLRLLGMMNISPLVETIVFSYNDRIMLNDSGDFRDFMKEWTMYIKNNDKNENYPFPYSHKIGVDSMIELFAQTETEETNDFDYLFELAQLEVALSYLNEDSLNNVKKHFDRISSQFKNNAIRQEVERYFVKHYARVRKNN